MRIVFLAHASSSIYYFRLALIKALIEQGHELFVISSADEYAEKIKKNKKIIFIENSLDLSTKAFKNVKDFFKLILILRKIRPHMIQSMGHKSNTLGLLAASFCFVKYKFALVEGMGNVFLDKDAKKTQILIIFLYKLVFKRVNAFIFVNESNKNIFLSWGLDEKKSIVIKSAGINLKRFLPLIRSEKEKESFYKKYGFKRKNTVVMVARPLIYKGIKLYLQAFKELSEYANFLLISQEIPKNPSKYYIKEELLKESKITIIKNCEEVEHILSYCDIFALPSYSEGLAISVLEAKACGCALVLSWCEGNIEVATQAVDALFHEVGNSKDLVKNIKYLLEDELLRKNLVKNGLKDVLKYDEEKIVKKYLLFYESIINVC